MGPPPISGSKASANRSQLVRLKPDTTPHLLVRLKPGTGRI